MSDRSYWTTKQVRACDIVVGDVIRSLMAGTTSWAKVTETGPSHATEYPELIWIAAEGASPFNHRPYSLIEIQVEEPTPVRPDWTTEQRAALQRWVEAENPSFTEAERVREKLRP